MSKSKIRRKVQRIYAWILAMALVLTSIIGNWSPVMAAVPGEVLNVTVTVIGDTANHMDDPTSHTGFVYWLKDAPLAVTLKDGCEDYIGLNCNESIPQLLQENGITADLSPDTLYPISMEKGGVYLEGCYPAGWSVIVQYPDGRSSSDGWGNYQGAARLEEGCRLIYYWKDSDEDCRITTDENWQSTLNYDTDAVTGISLHTAQEQDAPVKNLECEAGSQMNLITKLVVPELSTVSRELNWESTNPTVATVVADSNGAAINALSAGETDIIASMTNTLGEHISASCHLKVTATGTVYTGLAFAEGSSLTMNPEDQKTLTPVFTPEVPAGEQAPVLTWETRRPEVVTVTDGVVEAVAPGRAPIGAFFVNNQGETIRATCIVTVNEVSLKSISLDKTQVALSTGESTPISVVFDPINATQIPEIQWSVDKKTVATVEGTGENAKIIAVGGGEAIVTATAGEFTATCKVTVSGKEYIPLTSLTFAEGTSASIKTGETKVLTPVFNRELEKGEPKPVLTWKSDKPEVVKIDEVTGEMTAVSVGKTSIHVSFTNTLGKNVTASFEVTVEDANTKELKSLTFFQDKNGEKPYTVQKELDFQTNEMTVLVPENESDVYISAELNTGSEATITTSYLNWNKSQTLTENLTNGVLKGFTRVNRMLQADQEARDITFTVSTATKEEVYTVHLLRESLIRELKVTDVKGTELGLNRPFQSDVYEYEITVPETLTTVEISFSGHKAESKELKINGNLMENGKYTLTLDGNITKAVMTAGNSNVVPKEYVLTVKKVAPCQISFAVTPADAIVVVSDKTGRIWSENGIYHLLPDVEYTYTITKTGYVGQSSKFTVTDNKEIVVTLEKAPESTLPNYEAEWGGFRKDENNQAITQADTPTSKADVNEKWAAKVGDGFGFGAVSSPILVNGNLYCFAGDSILKVDKNTGKILKTGKMATSSFFAINPPCYANGMILVGIAGKIQAFNAETLESLWIYTDPLGGQTNCNIRYSDGYLYTGFWNGEVKKANFVCISATDEDPSNPKEEKHATWTKDVTGGFYWAGAYTIGDIVIVGSDDGDFGSTSDTSYLYVMNKYTGEMIQQIGPHHGDIRSDISYSNGRIYFTTKGGYLYSYTIGSDGKVDESSRKELVLGKMSTGTPAIVGNRLYVAHTDNSNFKGPYFIDVVSIGETGEMTLAYKVETEGYVQTSGSVSVKNGYNYVYFLDNSKNGNLYMIKDNASMMEADSESGILHTPSHVQYCIASPIIDNEGTLYFKNDSGYMFAIENKNPNPILSKEILSERVENGGKLAISSTQAGQLYYVTRSVDQAQPTLEEILAGKNVSLNVGDNTVSLEGFTKEASKLYMVVRSQNGKVSSIITVDVPEMIVRGDINQDGLVDFLDFEALLSALTNDTNVDANCGDINQDGKIDFVDVETLLKKLTMQ